MLEPVSLRELRAVFKDTVNVTHKGQYVLQAFLVLLFCILSRFDLNFR